MAAEKRSLADDGAASSSKKRRPSTDTAEVDDEQAIRTPANESSGHKRFGSEELEVERALPAPTEADDESRSSDRDEEDSDENSDDDGPEAVGTADAQAVARAEAVEAAKALQADRSKARKERQDRAAYLKAQAETSSRKKENTVRQDAAEDVEPAKKSARQNIPDLLPDDILADETIRQRNSPESAEEVDEAPAPKAPSNRRIVKFDATPKDVDAGPVRVRVLEGRNKYMAPKANKTSRSIKENWLAGRRGKALGVERHKPNRGFLTS